MGMLITGRRVVLSREEGERGGSGLALIVGEKRGRREVEDQKKIEEDRSGRLVVLKIWEVLSLVVIPL